MAKTDPDDRAPDGVDLEAARAAFAGMTCPMTDHDTADDVPTEVVESMKLTTEDQATDHVQFLGRKVPVRPMIVIRCTDEDCNWGQEVVALPSSDPKARTVVPPQVTHAGLGYTSVPPPEVGA